jgi:hypothetical protein
MRYVIWTSEIERAAINFIVLQSYFKHIVKLQDYNRLKGSGSEGVLRYAVGRYYP